METEFKNNDVVIYYREATEEEWEGIGQITPPFELGDSLIIERVNSKSLVFTTDLLNYPKTSFKSADTFPEKGDYVVTLEVAGARSNCGRDNYCFKLRETSFKLCPCIDLNGSSSNGHDYMSWDLKHILKKWRYATADEINRYDRLGKPFDVTKMIDEFPSTSPAKFNVGDYVKIINHGSGFGYESVGKTVVITEIGEYLGGIGYKVSPLLGNTLSGACKGFNGEDFFKSAKLQKKDCIDSPVIQKNSTDCAQYNAPKINTPEIKLILVSVPKI